MGSNTVSSSRAPPTGDTGALIITQTDTASPGTQVRHFDELSEDAQQLIAEFDGKTNVVQPDDGLKDEFVDETVVVFTDYYRISVV